MYYQSMAGVYNYTWVQGEDLDIYLVYKTGNQGETPTPVDLTGYQFRMDIGTPEAGMVYSVNTNDTDGSVDNVTLGADGSIDVVIPREVLLPDGALYDLINGLPASTTFHYDMFIQDEGGKYHRVLKGQIYVDKSTTLWTQ